MQQSDVIKTNISESISGNSSLGTTKLFIMSTLSEITFIFQLFSPKNNGSSS